MIGGGEFIINGAIRVIVNQLHRSPGVDFLIESKEGDRVLHGARVIPERGSWLELGVSHKDTLVVRVDQSSKLPATIFLRAISPQFSTTEQILREFYPTRTVPANKLTPTMWAVEPIVDPQTGEVIVKAGTQIGDRVSLIQNRSIFSGTATLAKIGKKEEAEDWLDKKGRNWLEKNQDDLRKKYMVKGSELTGGFALKFVVTEKGGEILKDEKKDEKGDEKGELSALEAAVARRCEFGSKKKSPRFNNDDGLLSQEEVDRLWKKNPRLEELFQECLAAIKSDSDWIEIENLDEYKKVPNKQGIYFFKSLKNGKVNDGYVGKAGEERRKSPKGQGLRGRLKKHFRDKYKATKPQDCGDNLLKTWAVTELLEYGVPFEDEPRDRKRAPQAAEIEVIDEVRDTLILNTLADDDCHSHEQALLKFYIRLRPGSPPSEEKAKTFFSEKFFDPNRYRLGKVGRFRLNRKFGQSVDENEMTLRPEDLLNTMKYILALRNNQGGVDDIDQIGRAHV